MTELSLEVRPEGSLLMTARRGAPRAIGLLGLGAGAVLLSASLLGAAHPVVVAVLTGPAAVILLLAGWAALRHRDWILFDGPGRRVLHRRGLGSMFRAAGTVPFEDVAALRVGPGPEGGSLVHLRLGDGALWPVAVLAAPGSGDELVAAIRRATGWPVEVVDTTREATSGSTGEPPGNARVARQGGQP